ncbi:MAG: DUF922 domain-containing protein [Myxococcota bacterium]
MPETVAAAEGVTVETRYEPWIVTGIEPDEIVREARRNGPKGRFSWTGWHLAPRFPYRRARGACTTGPVRTKLTVTHALPVWKPRKPPRDAIEAAWADNLRDVIAHAGVRRDNAVEAANALQQALSDLGPERDCKLLRARARNELKRISDSHRRRDDELSADNWDEAFGR